jgi:integrase
VAGSRMAWEVAHCAAVLAASTTSRKIELQSLRCCDVDLFSRLLQIRRSKTAAGHREVPLNDDAVSSLAGLRSRSEADSFGRDDHFVFPACENNRLDGTKHQKSWRTAWRTLIRSAVRIATEQNRLELAAALNGFRFHDLRHQAITELVEAGVPDRVMNPSQAIFRGG